MICPKCGHEMPEGHLLCEKCGAEINIVPDFDIEVENSISETMNNIGEDIVPNSSTKHESPKTKEEKMEEEFFKESILSSSKTGNKKFFILIGAVLAFCIAIILVALFCYRNLSVSYQLKQVDKCLESSNYSKALDYINKAKEIRSNDLDIQLKEASVYIFMGDFDEAKGLLNEGIENKNMDYPHKESFYRSLIDIYKLEVDFDTINSLLLNSGDEHIMECFSEYISLPPIFSLETGTYDEATTLEISDENFGEGKIMYTVNGTIPSDINGIKYFGPIDLTAGEYDIRAVYVNKYGVCSEVVGNYYLVAVEKPKEPEIEPSSGNFDHPIKVTANVPEGVVVYYTSDGTDPDSEMSPIYEGPIDVPVGNFNYCFLAVNEYGISSDIVRRSYNIKLNTNVTPKMAEYKIIDSLTRQGIINANGQAADGGGIYSFIYDGVIEINGLYFYKFTEYLTAGNGIKTPTGLLYAVDTEGCNPFRLLVETDGNWGLILLE